METGFDVETNLFYSSGALETGVFGKLAYLEPLELHGWSNMAPLVYDQGEQNPRPWTVLLSFHPSLRLQKKLPESQSPTDPQADNAGHVLLDGDVEAGSNWGTAVFLGTGTSVGVPSIGCECAVCSSDDPRNKRLRCAMLLHLPGGLLLIDSPPDLRTQLLREKVRIVHSVLYTHEHADHLFGLDDLRLFPFRLGHAMPLFCESKVEERIRKSFDYAFIDREETHPGSRPSLEFRTITHEPFEILGATVTPIPMKHGPHFDVLGFRFGDFAYCTDTNEIPDSSLELLQGLDTFVVGALRETYHPTHYSLEGATAVAEKIKPRQTFFTHLCHDVDHETACRALPDGVDLAYDGLRVRMAL